MLLIKEKIAKQMVTMNIQDDIKQVAYQNSENT